MRGQDSASTALLFSGLDAPELLARLSDGDVLRLYERCAVRVRERALLMDVDRLYSQALVNVVAAGEPLDRDTVWQWVDARVGDAITDLLKEDEACLKSQVPVSGDQPHMTVQAILGLDPHGALAAAVAFNSLEFRTRRACVALFIEHRTLAECIEAGFGGLEELRDSAQQGMTALIDSTPASQRESASLGRQE